MPSRPRRNPGLLSLLVAAALVALAVAGWAALRGSCTPAAASGDVDLGILDIGLPGMDRLRR